MGDLSVNVIMDTVTEVFEYLQHPEEIRGPFNRVCKECLPKILFRDYS